MVINFVNLSVISLDFEILFVSPTEKESSIKPTWLIKQSSNMFETIILQVEEVLSGKYYIHEVYCDLMHKLQTHSACRCAQRNYYEVETHDYLLNKNNTVHIFIIFAFLTPQKSTWSVPNTDKRRTLKNKILLAGLIYVNDINNLANCEILRQSRKLVV